MMIELKIKMKINSEKKHSVRYDVMENQTNDPAITSIYVMKSSLVKPYPETITVKIEMET